MTEVGTLLQLAGIGLMAGNNIAMFYTSGNAFMASSQSSHLGALTFAIGTVI